MDRPTILQVGGVLYWVLHTRNPDTMVLKDADSDPTVAVRKNGASVADSVTVTKRAATTGIYDCSYNPAAEVEGDSFTLEETAVVTGTTTGSATYKSSFVVRVVAVVGALNNISAADVVTAMETNGSKLDHLWEMTEDDAGVRRLTANALEEAPAVSGTDWTTDEKTAIRSILGVPVSGTTPEDPTSGILDTIRDDTNELQTDWVNGGRLDLILDIIAADTTTDIPALIATVDTWVKRNAVILSGLISTAGTATEVFTIGAIGVTATVSVDASGNRTAVVWS